MTDFIASLIDGSRHEADLAEARRLMAVAKKPAKRRIRYFPRNERSSEVATLVAVEVSADDTFAVYCTAHHLGM